MEKLSVKKPFTILVAVILVLVLGVVSLSNMVTDLLPPMSLPYLIVITTYPGASPERVESDVVRPMESTLGTINGVKNVYSTAAENYGSVQLEFEDGTDMDSTMVKVSQALNELSASLPDMCSTPSIIEISMDMMATMYVSVSREGYDIYQLSAFVTDTVQPYVERQNGVASVSPMGIVEKSVHVELDSAKITALNDRILEAVNEQLAAAGEELDKAEKQVKDSKEALAQAQASFGATMAGTIFDQLDGSIASAAAEMKVQVDTLLEQVRQLRASIKDNRLRQTLDSIIEALEELSALLDGGDLKVEDIITIASKLRTAVNDLLQLLRDLETSLPENDLAQLEQALNQIEDTLGQLSGVLDSVPQILAGLEDAIAGMTQGQLEAAVGFATATTQLTAAETELAAARVQYEKAREEALSGANLDKLLSVTTLSQLIYAQNFSMPAGYINDGNGTSWLLKVGDEYESADDIAGALLVSMEGIGEVRISDVATVTVIDNAGLSYTRLNGEEAVILSIFKGSTTGTNETAKNCLEAFDELEAKYDGLNIATLMNQGSYIDLIISSVLSSMVLGAILAIIILALFLKDVKPTLVVAISIPLSVLFSLVLMYFTDISLNMMTLSGLTLGIGMLVDNSIVVIENIYRLRARGISAPRAAVQGTKQVAGAITSSTLTTVCVFLPMVFTSGMVRELLLPLGLTIGYCLMASLLVALTVAPAAASTLLKNAEQKAHPWFDKFLDAYEKALDWCLRHKAVPLSASIVLLIICIVIVLNMGIVIIPEMTGNQITVSVSTPDGLTREESYAMADDVVDMLLEIEEIQEVGAMDSGSTMSLLGGMGGSSSSYGSYTYYIVLPGDTSASRIQAITNQINEAAADMPCTVTANAGGMDDMTALLGSGLSLKIYGNDLDTLRDISDEVVKIVETVPGYTDIRTSFTDGDPTIHLVIDKDKAMAKGLTVAQIYMAISERLTTSATSTSVTIDGVNLDVTVENNRDPLTVENLLDITFDSTTTDLTGAAVTTTHKLSDFATVEETTSVGSINRENQTRYVTVSAGVAEGQNATLLSRELNEKLQDYINGDNLPYGYTLDLGGESSTVNEMVEQMLLLLLLGFLFIYLIMVVQFQSLLSPFIVIFTIPLAFTGGLIALLIYGQQLSLLSIMGFAVLMGTVVNNGIVFVDYANQLRLGGMERRAALIATGKTRMRPVLMTALTTILGMSQMVFSDDMAGQLGGGMSIVIIGGMIYATAMTLIIIPVVYDIFFKRQPLEIDLGSESLDDIPDDAAEFIAQAKAAELAAAEAAQSEATEDPQ